MHRLSITSLLFACDDSVLMEPLACDLQHSLDWFKTKCEGAGMMMSTSESAAMVLSRKLDCQLQVGSTPSEGVKVSQGLGVADWPENWSSGRGFVLALQHGCHEKTAEPEGKALYLTFKLHFYPQLGSLRMGQDQKNEMTEWLKRVSSGGWLTSPRGIG